MQQIIGAEIDENCAALYKKLEIFKLKDSLKNIHLMWYFDHNELPKNIQTCFIYANRVQEYPLRFSSLGKLCEIRKYNSKTHGLDCFVHNRPKLLNMLKSCELYRESKTKACFLTNCKKLSKLDIKTNTIVKTIT